MKNSYKFTVYIHTFDSPCIQLAISDGLLIGLYMFTCVSQWQELTVLPELQVHVSGSALPRGTVCHMRARVSLHRVVSRVSPVAAHEWWHQLSWARPVSWRQVCPLLRDSGHAKLHVWYKLVSLIDQPYYT